MLRRSGPLPRRPSGSAHNKNCHIRLKSVCCYWYAGTHYRRTVLYSIEENHYGVAVLKTLRLEKTASGKNRRKRENGKCTMGTCVVCVGIRLSWRGWSGLWGKGKEQTLILQHLKVFINLSPLKYYSHIARYFLFSWLSRVYIQYNVFCIMHAYLKLFTHRYHAYQWPIGLFVL